MLKELYYCDLDVVWIAILFSVLIASLRDITSFGKLGIVPTIIANFIVLAPRPTATLLNSDPRYPLTNGKSTAMEASNFTNDDAPYDSESDLSDVAIPIVDDRPSPATSENHQSEFGTNDHDDSESSAAEPIAEDDDADFDMEGDPPTASNGIEQEDSSSDSESRRPAKRKLDEKRHMEANPELYGLRRSVRVLLVASFAC